MTPLATEISEVFLKFNKDLIIKCKNEYTKESPTIDHKSIQIRDNLIELTKLI